MAYPDDKKDFTPVASPEWTRQGHINELQTLLETLQDILGTFPNWTQNGVADIGKLFKEDDYIIVRQIGAKDDAGININNNAGGLTVRILDDGKIGVLKQTPIVELDVAGEINSTYGFYHDRGDPNAYDYDLGDLTEDNNWHDLDLSGIVPVNTKAVVLFVNYRASVADVGAFFRKNGNTFDKSKSGVRAQVANIYSDEQFMIACDGDRKVEYTLASPQTNRCNITVLGWFK